jgi:hypothetical protein
MCLVGPWDGEVVGLSGRCADSAPTDRGHASLFESSATSTRIGPEDLSASTAEVVSGTVVYQTFRSSVR